MPAKKIDKNASDKVISPEQALVNSAITQAAALAEIANCLNDIASNQEILLEIELKRARQDGVINPTEYDEMSDNSDDDDESEN